MRARAIGLLLGSALICVGSLAMARAAAPLPRILSEDFGTRFEVRPAQIIVSGDGSAIIAGNAAWIGRNPGPTVAGSQFGHIEWLGWKTSSATAFATLWLNNCKPDCAQGTYFPKSVLMSAYRVRDGLFSRLALRPAGGKTATLFKLQHAGAGYVWASG